MNWSLKMGSFAGSEPSIRCLSPILLKTQSVPLCSKADVEPETVMMVLICVTH